MPKLRDLGVAELLDAEGGERDAALPTVRLMTPEYASPTDALKAVHYGHGCFRLGVLLMRYGAAATHFAPVARPAGLDPVICGAPATASDGYGRTNPDRAAHLTHAAGLRSSTAF